MEFRFRAFVFALCCVAFRCRVACLELGRLQLRVVMFRCRFEKFTVRAFLVARAALKRLGVGFMSTGLRRLWLHARLMCT